MLPGSITDGILSDPFLGNLSGSIGTAATGANPLQPLAPLVGQLAGDALHGNLTAVVADVATLEGSASGELLGLNITQPSAFPDNEGATLVGDLNPFNSNFTGALASEIEGAVASEVEGALRQAQPFGGGNLTLPESILQDAEGIAQEAALAAANKPTYVDEDQHAYYDSDTAILGSWRWPSCDHRQMYTCHARGHDSVSACCCRPGHAYAPTLVGSVAGRNGSVQVAQVAAAAAIAGSVIQGVLGGAAAPVPGIHASVVESMASGRCTRKDQLAASVQKQLG